MADAQQLAPAEEPAALNQPAAEPAPAGQDSVTLTTEPPAVGQKRSLEQAEEGGQGEQAGGAGDEPAAAGGEPPATEAPEVKRQAVAADALPAATPAPASASEPQQVASQTAVPPGLDTPRETIFRLVLNVMDTALIIGKGGMTVRQIETETGARVKRMQDPPGAREQVVIIWTPALERPAGSGLPDPAQRALFDCVRRVLTQADVALSAGPQMVKLLVSRTQEGAATAAAEEVRSRLGVKLAIKDSLPACALDTDLLLEVTGERGALMQAMHLLSWHLRANPPLETPGKAPPALRELTMPQAEPQTLAPRQQAGVYAAPPQLSPGQV